MARIPAQFAFAAAALASAAAVAGDLPTQTFDNGVLHFESAPGLLITSTDVRAPEGVVEVIVVQPTDANSGAVSSPSFVSLTVFRAALDGGTQPIDAVLGGVRASLPGADLRQTDAAERTLFGERVAPQQLVLSRDGAQATAMAAQVAGEGDLVVVVYDQRAAGEGAEVGAALDGVVASLAFGPAPEPEPAQEPSEPAGGDDHGNAQHGQPDEHDEQGHDEHGGHEEHGH